MTDCHTSRRSFVAALCGAAASSSSLPGADDDFKQIFNGSDLSGWEGDSFLWKVEDGALTGRSPGIPYNDFLATTERYSDFILRFRVHLLGNEGNSGVQFRSERVPGSMEMIGYQADIGPSWWGNLYDESRRRVTLVEAPQNVIRRALKPDGYNDYEIHAEGPKIVLRINGQVTVDYTEEDNSIPQNGLIALQIHSGPAMEVRFKDIRIKEL